ncbi:MAG: primosomal protein N' [Planctomycetota bacterium]
MQHPGSDKNKQSPLRARYAVVAIEGPLKTVYHYRIPEALLGRVEPGMRVAVPFGRQKAHGFVVEMSDAAPIAESRIKELASVASGEALASPEILGLARWIGEYYHCGWGEVLAAALPKAVRRGMKEESALHAELVASKEVIDAALPVLLKKAPRQAAVVQALLDAPGPMKIADIMNKTGASRTAFQALEKKGLLAVASSAVHRELAAVSDDARIHDLSPGQSKAISEILPVLDGREFGVFLLHGATASGKTEVYLRALEHCLKSGRTGIVLVPEISLTPQTVERFRARVGEVAVLHSHMAEGQRAAEWRRLRRGEVRVAVGARSAVFAPLPDLGLLVVDEEHERTFKQDSAPRYHARDVAVVRGRQCRAVVILGSATPSLESFQNARTGKYRLLSLPDRVGGGRVPRTEIVNLRTEWAEQKRETLISRKLERAMRASLSRKEQTILFLNRRGFHTWVHCLHCGAALECPNCDISLTYHRAAARLRCHYCGHGGPVPEACPACGAKRLRFAGSGTERALEAVSGLFPEARILRMDSDTMTGRESHAEALAAFARGEYDILLGTQMIAKGLDFPAVTVIGVLLADGSIRLPDFRAPEHTFELVMQVVGRSGRGRRPGLGVVQALSPDHYAVALAAKQDYLAFAERELSDRARHGYPPFGRLARVLVRGPDKGRCARHIEAAARALRAAGGPKAVLGPAACAIGRIQSNFRFHVLVKAKTPSEIARILAAAEHALRDKGKVKLVVDIDPVSLL